MAKLRVHNIESGPVSSDVAFGISGDTIAVSSDSIKLNTWKDSGGNTLFVSDGTGTLSSVNSGLSGAGPKFIQTQTAAASSVVSFTSNIDSTYNEYLFVFYDIICTAGEPEFQFNVSTDGGSSYAVNKTSTYYDAMHRHDGVSGTLQYVAAKDLSSSASYQPLIQKMLHTGHYASAATSGTLRIYNVSSTTYVKNFYAHTHGVTDDADNKESRQAVVGGVCETTTAINTVSFNLSSGTFSGTIKMYGVS